MAASLSGLSASVTRILSLTGFAKELKTKDIQTAFSEWENVNGGFKIKWKDDTSLLIVFQDATVAKRAYLSTIASPPAALSASGTTAVVKPYDGPDAQNVIQSVNSRGQHTSNPSRGHNMRAASISVFPNRGGSTANGIPGNNFRNGGNAVNHNGTIPEHPQYANGISSPVDGREPSPTLPNLPSHPTLNALISSSLGEAVASEGQLPPPVDPAIVATSLHPEGIPARGPQIGDPGKRMLGAALGVRHPGLPPRVMNGGANSEHGMREMQRAMGGLTVAE